MICVGNLSAYSPTIYGDCLVCSVLLALALILLLRNPPRAIQQRLAEKSMSFGEPRIGIAAFQQYFGILDFRG